MPALRGSVDLTLYAVLWRPAAPDPDDDFVLECAFNAGACLVSHNRRHLAGPSLHLGIEWLPPGEFLPRLSSSE